MAGPEGREPAVATGEPAQLNSATWAERRKRKGPSEETTGPSRITVCILAGRAW
jgi:hypothetical protein